MCPDRQSVVEGPGRHDDCRAGRNRATYLAESWGNGIADPVQHQPHVITEDKSSALPCQNVILYR
jgi:hypothetical protein